jgi:hypothetical protein
MQEQLREWGASICKGWAGAPNQKGEEGGRGRGYQEGIDVADRVGGQMATCGKKGMATRGDEAVDRPASHLASPHTKEV